MWISFFYWSHVSRLSRDMKSETFSISLSLSLCLRYVYKPVDDAFRLFHAAGLWISFLTFFCTYLSALSPEPLQSPFEEKKYIHGKFVAASVFLV